MKLDKSNEEIAAHIQHSLDIDKHNLGERGEHQREALKRVAEHLVKNVGDTIVLPEGQHHDEHADYLTEKQSDNFLVVSATGTGKTRILGGIMDGAEVPTLLLTPRKLLNKQMMDEFCDEMGISRDKVGLIDGDVQGAARKEALAKPYLISTMQSLSTLVDKTTGKYRLRPELGMRKMCLLDEAHTAQGPQISSILNDLKEEMILGGVTATEAGVSNTLFDGQAPIFNLDLVTAIEQGKLATGVKTGVIDVKLDEDWVEQLTQTPMGQEYSRKALERFAKTPATIKAMAQFHLSHVDDELGKIDRFPSLVFTEGIAAARQGAEMFNEMAQASGSKARAGFVSGDMDSDMRNHMLESFRKGDISILFNDRMLEMGYDLPEASVVYSLKPTQYRHTAEQQLGRVTRKEPKDYFDKYGMHKVALAINVRPEGVVPYLFGEVIGNRPSLYQAGMEPPSKGGNSSLGGVETQLKLDDAEFHTNYDEIASILVDASKRRIVMPTKSGWYSAMDLAATHVGGKSKISRALKLYREEKYNLFIAEGMSAEQAETLVENDWVGSRNTGGTKTLCASAAAIQDMHSQQIIRRKDEKAPTKDDWSSALDLDLVYVGDRFLQRLKDYRIVKISELIAKGLSKEDAEITVESFWVGFRSSGTSEGLCASPTAVAEMITQEKLRRKDSKALPKHDWVSTVDLHGIYVGNRKISFLQRLEDYRTDKIKEFVAEGMPQTAAEMLVEKDWVAVRSSGSSQGLCASPTAIVDMEAKGCLQHKEALCKNNAPDKGEWSSTKDAEKKYVGSKNKFAVIFSRFREEKLKEFIAQGMPLADAGIIVERDWIGERNSGSIASQCASPEAITVLLGRGDLRDKAAKAPPKEDWASIKNLETIYVGGRASKFATLLDNLRSEKLEELVARGMSCNDAEIIIERDWVGMRSSSQGNESQCASPIAMADLEAKGKLIRKEKANENQPFVERVQSKNKSISPEAVAEQKAQRGGWGKKAS